MREAKDFALELVLCWICWSAPLMKLANKHTSHFTRNGIKANTPFRDLELHMQYFTMQSSVPDNSACSGETRGVKPTVGSSI